MPSIQDIINTVAKKAKEYTDQTDQEKIEANRAKLTGKSSYTNPSGTKAANGETSEQNVSQDKTEKVNRPDPFKLLKEQQSGKEIEDDTTAYSLLQQLMSKTPEQLAKERAEGVSEQEQVQQQENQNNTQNQEQEASTASSGEEQAQGFNPWPMIAAIASPGAGVASSVLNTVAANNPELAKAQQQALEPILNFILPAQKAEAQEISEGEQTQEQASDDTESSNNNSLRDKLDFYAGPSVESNWKTLQDKANDWHTNNHNNGNETDQDAKRRAEILNASNLGQLQDETIKWLVDNDMLDDTASAKQLELTSNSPSSSSGFSAGEQHDYDEWFRKNVPYTSHGYQGEGTIYYDIMNKPRSEWGDNTKKYVDNFSSESMPETEISITPYIDEQKEVYDKLQEVEKLNKNEEPKTIRDIFNDLMSNTDAGKAYTETKQSEWTAADKGDYEWNFDRDLLDLQQDGSDVAKNLWIAYYTDPRYGEDLIRDYSTDIDPNGDGEISGAEAEAYWKEQRNHEYEASDDPLSSDDKYVKRAYGISADGNYDSDLLNAINYGNVSRAAQKNKSILDDELGWSAQTAFNAADTAQDLENFGMTMMGNGYGDFLFRDADTLQNAMNGDSSTLSSLSQLLTMTQEGKYKGNGNYTSSIENIYDTDNQYVRGKKEDKVAAKDGKLYAKEVAEPSNADWQSQIQQAYQTGDTSNLKRSLASSWGYDPNNGYSVYELDPAYRHTYKLDTNSWKY